jgi:hypothetical protein
MQDYYFLQDLLDTYQSLSDWLKLAWLVVPCATIVALASIGFRQREVMSLTAVSQSSTPEWARRECLTSAGTSVPTSVHGLANLLDANSCPATEGGSDAEGLEARLDRVIARSVRMNNVIAGFRPPKTETEDKGDGKLGREW